MACNRHPMSTSQMCHACHCQLHAMKKRNADGTVHEVRGLRRCVPPTACAYRSRVVTLRCAEHLAVLPHDSAPDVSFPEPQAGEAEGFGLHPWRCGRKGIRRECASAEAHVYAASSWVRWSFSGARVVQGVSVFKVQSPRSSGGLSHPKTSPSPSRARPHSLTTLSS